MTIISNLQHNLKHNLSHNTTSRWIIKLVILAILCIAIYNLTNRVTFELFTNKIEEEKKQYLKFNETYLNTPKSNKDKPTLELLYANYSGDEVGTDKWENKTLSQCIDTCNKLENCSGFSRDLVDDSENATCYPRTHIDACHSNRKGDFQQRQHALAFNTYVKSSVNGALTKCLGDANLTLGRPIFIKSHAYPTKYVGINENNELSLVDRNENSATFFDTCKFKVETGLDGSGTVSIKHVSSGKYLFRDSTDMIVVKGVPDKAKTEDKQRASFHIYDGLSNQIVFKCMPLNLENSDRFVSVYKDNHKYLNAINSKAFSGKSSNDEKPSKLKAKEMKIMTFEIVDTVISSSIIDNKKYIGDAMSPIKTYPATPNKLVAISDDDPIQPQVRRSITSEKFGDTTSPTKALDLSSDNYNYYSLLGGKNTDKNLTNMIQDAYINKPVTFETNKLQENLSQKFNNFKAKANLMDITKQNEQEYSTLQNLNKQLETAIANQNMELSRKNDMLTNNVDKLKIQELSSDYFFMQNLMKNQLQSK